MVTLALLLKPSTQPSAISSLALNQLSRSGPVRTEHLRYLLHRLEPGTHGFVAPRIEELSCPGRGNILPESLEVLLEQVFMDIFLLHNQGHSQRAIAKKLGIHRDTVKNHLETGEFPGPRKAARKFSILAPITRSSVIPSTRMTIRRHGSIRDSKICK